MSNILFKTRVVVYIFFCAQKLIYPYVWLPFVVQEDNLIDKLKRYMQTAGCNTVVIADTESLCAVCKCIRFSNEPDDVKKLLFKLAEDAHTTQYHMESADEFYNRMKKKYPPSR
jgi:hypothetical protein